MIQYSYTRLSLIYILDWFIKDWVDSQRRRRRLPFTEDLLFVQNNNIHQRDWIQHHGDQLPSEM